MAARNNNDDDNEWKVRLLALNERIRVAENKLTIIEEESIVFDPIYKIQQELMRYNIYTARFHYVLTDYYESTLEQRALLLNCTVPQLCKSIIFENTAYTNDNITIPSDNSGTIGSEERDHHFLLGSKYYCVITQYISKVNTNAMKILLQQLSHNSMDNIKNNTSKLMKKKKYHFQLASNEDSYRLTGYQHNAIAPLAFTFHPHDVEEYNRNHYYLIPIIICKKCVDLYPLPIFLGGGKIDVKLSMSITDLIRVTHAIVGNVTDERR